MDGEIFSETGDFVWRNFLIRDRCLAIQIEIFLSLETFVAAITKRLTKVADNRIGGFDILGKDGRDC